MPKKDTHTSNKQASLQALQELIYTAERSLHHAKTLLAQITGKKPVDIPENSERVADLHTYKHGKARVIEGIFTGKDMLGTDHKLYPVPANYASKSKIVEGSKLKCTIKADGALQYKIIKEVDFVTSTGTIIRDGDHFVVVSQDGMYQLLPAAVTYIRARVGDRIAIRIPKGKKATYATIEARIPAEVGLTVA